MSSNLGTMPPKLLPISTKHGERDLHVIGQYENVSKNFVMGDESLEDEEGRG